MSRTPVDVFAIICGKNCDMKIKDKFGDTCLHKMVGRGDAAACEMLCQVWLPSICRDCLSELSACLVA
jgi:hypothetical protein